MKGVELPINILVVVVIAIIVLLGLVALYFIGFNPFSVMTALDATKSTECREYLNQYPTICYDSSKVTFDYPPGNHISLWNFTDAYYTCNSTGTHNEQCTRRVCGCPAY